jgi:hypothetical protein
MYREYRDDTIELILGALRKRSSVEQFAKIQKVGDHPFFKTVVFELLLTRYRLSRRISRRKMREMMEEGTFWEDFLAFLQEVDWEKVLEIVMTIVEMILALI